MEEYMRLNQFSSSMGDNAGQACKAYFGDEWYMLKVESYEEFEMIYEKSDAFLEDYIDSLNGWNRLLWFGTASSSASNEPFQFQDESYTEFGQFATDSTFNLDANIFSDLPTTVNGRDLWLDSLNYGEYCSVMWLQSDTNHDLTFPSVLDIEDCGRAGIGGGAGLPYVCEKSSTDDDCDCSIITMDTSPLYNIGEYNAESTDPLAPFDDITVSFKGINSGGTSLVYEYNIECSKLCFISDIDISGSQFTNSDISLFDIGVSTTTPIGSESPVSSATDVNIDMSGDESYALNFKLTETENEDDVYRTRSTVKFKQFLQLSHVREWNDISSRTVNADGNYGFYSPTAEKIFMLGKQSTIQEFDFQTETWNTGKSVNGDSPYTTSFVRNSDGGGGGQMGALIDNIFYFQNDDESNKIYTYNVDTNTVSRSYLTIPDGDGKCFTADVENNVLYIINNNHLYSVDVSLSSPSYVSLADLPYDTAESDNTYMACSYMNNVLYVFGGWESTKILKYAPTGDSWSILSSTISTGPSQSQIVHDVIFVQRKGYVNKFDPTTEIIQEQIRYPKDSYETPLIFSGYDDRLYAIAGFSYGDNVVFRSNVLAATSEETGIFKLCVEDMEWGDTAADSIEARLWYSEEGPSYHSTEWTSLGAQFGIEMKGKCIDFLQFADYADKEWQYLDLYTCSNDGLGIDAIVYWDVLTQTYITHTEFYGSSSCNYDEYLWMKGTHSQCYAISVRLDSGDVFMNPDWISEFTGQNCETVNSDEFVDEECRVPILGNDHSWWPGEKIGQYFSFDASIADCILGDPYSSGSVTEVWYSGTNEEREVKIWRGDIVDTGDQCTECGNGRKNSGPADGDWEIGEYFVFEGVLCNPACLQQTAPSSPLEFHIDLLYNKYDIDVVGLLMVLIVLCAMCVLVNCCRKYNKNAIKYSTVSMTNTDTEEYDTEAPLKQ